MMFVSGVTKICMRQIGLLAACLLGAACGPTGEPSVEISDLSPAYTGAASCKGCHEPEFKLWQDSHHARAMQHATPASVLGDFSGVEFRHFEITSTFFIRDGGFFVRTENADGELQDFPIKYTFGVTPLQQYLIEFPGGRLQPLLIAWDSRDREQGGQRWFHLYPNEPILYDDELHWTGRQQNWNFMCAECHSTNLAKNYSVVEDSYDTTWSEINVSCEACHGPASNHVIQAEAGEFSSSMGLLTDLDDQGRAVWEMNADTGIASRSELRTRLPAQPEACGRCHSRRSVVAANYEFGRSLFATHSPVLLDDGLYFADGQIRDEVYVYGSFVQSRMYQAGVSCSDCHEPHSGVLRTGSDPNDICATCHLPARFASAAHHHHKAESAGCVDCHMPSRDYMVVDGRRDHSFRRPRPDLTIATGSPNACNQCHTNENAKWAMSATEDWYGQNRPGHYGIAIHAARAGMAKANGSLIATINDRSVPGIARGTALSELRAPYSQDIARVIQSALADADPFVRLGALRALAGLPEDLVVGWAAPLLQDRLLAIRVEAVGIISPMRGLLDARFEGAFAVAEQEYVDSRGANAERPEAHGNLGSLYAAAGNTNLGEAEFQTALRLDPRSVGQRANLADLYRQLNRDDDAEVLLRQGIELAADEAALHHALGLLLVRNNRAQEGLDELRHAAELQTANARFLYVYAVALNSFGESDAAVELLMRGMDDFPADFDIQWALATILRDLGRNDDAREIVQSLAARYPDVQSIRDLSLALQQ